MILGFIFLVLDHLWLLSKIIFPENWPPDFPFKYLPLLFTDLFYFAYLTLVYKRAKSKDGFIQTKKIYNEKRKNILCYQVSRFDIVKISILPHSNFYFMYWCNFC